MEYPETKQTLDAILNIGGDKQYVKFTSIYKEVQRIRLTKNLKAEPKNLRGRVRRSLINNANTGIVRNTEQSKKLSIMANYPYKVIPKNPIRFNDKAMGNVQDIENNSFLIEKK